MNWEQFENFSEEEFECQCGCGRADMDEGVLARLQQIRTKLGFPFPINSGFRCPSHNESVSSTGRDGPHTTGKAIDVGLSRVNARLFLEEAVLVFSGVGVQQKGEGRFIHVDTLGYRIWSY